MKPNHIYLIKRTDIVDFDQYGGFVIVTKPDDIEYIYSECDDPSEFGTGRFTIDNTELTYLGDTHKDVGIILGDFNAG